MTYTRARAIGCNDVIRVEVPEVDLFVALDVITDDDRFTPREVNLYQNRIETEIRRRRY